MNKLSATVTDMCPRPACYIPSPSMGAAYTPGLKVTARAVVRKARRLPLAGQVLVKVSDRVTARQVVARTDCPAQLHGPVVAVVIIILIAGILFWEKWTLPRHRPRTEGEEPPAPDEDLPAF